MYYSDRMDPRLLILSPKTTDICLIFIPLSKSATTKLFTIKFLRNKYSLTLQPYTVPRLPFGSVLCSDVRRLHFGTPSGIPRPRSRQKHDGETRGAFRARNILHLADLDDQQPTEQEPGLFARRFGLRRVVRQS